MCHVHEPTGVYQQQQRQRRERQAEATIRHEAELAIVAASFVSSCPWCSERIEVGDDIGTSDVIRSELDGDGWLCVSCARTIDGANR